MEGIQLVMENEIWQITIQDVLEDTENYIQIKK